MNHIAKLTQDRENLMRQIQWSKKGINDFLAYLQTSPKFQGTESDGSRKDWIATADVINTLREIRSHLVG